MLNRFLLPSPQILTEWPYHGLGGAHGLWKRINVLSVVAGKPEGESPQR